MILEINKLLNSEDKRLSKIGWLFYNREDQSGGLTKQETEELLDLLTPINFEDVAEENYEIGKQEGFVDGYELGVQDGMVKAMTPSRDDKLSKEIILRNLAR